MKVELPSSLTYLPPTKKSHHFKKKAFRPCKVCGKDRGVNRWFCKKCHSYVSRYYDDPTCEIVDHRVTL